MKKILFLLLFTVSIYGQTLQNPTFGIVTEKNNATDNTPAYFTTTQVDGVHKKTPAALVAKTATVNDSLATKENVANKSDSYTASSSTTYASTKALVDGLGTKLNVVNPEALGTLSVKNTGQDTAALGAELLTNGSFATDLSSWTAGANWSYSSGGALHTIGSVATLTQNVSVVSGNTYLVTVTMSGRTTGDLVFQLGDFNYPFSFSNSGNYNTAESKTFVATSTGSITFTMTPTTDFNGKIDEVNIKLVTLNSVSSTQNIFNTSNLLSNELRANADLNNIFFGLNSGSSNVNGARNISFGIRNLEFLTTGYQNNTFGYETMRYNTTGFSNTAGGFQALTNNTNGSRNSSFGVYSMLNNTTGSNNTAFGTHSLQSGTTGNDNVAIGMSSMMIGINTGSYNVAIGSNSLYKNTTGNYNISEGFQSLYNNTTGGSNIGIGLQALFSNITSTGNNALGASSLIATTGAFNTAIGNNSGKSLTNGNHNTFVGASAGFNALQLVSATNSTAIGNEAYTTASNQVVLGNSSITETLIRGNVPNISLTGTPTAPTATAGTNTTQIATTAFVQGEKAITVRKISTNTTLADSDNGKVILLTASCTVTLPNGLMNGFNCSFATQAGATLTYSLGGSVVLINNVGTTMAEKLSHTIVNTGVSNEYLTAGSL